MKKIASLILGSLLATTALAEEAQPDLQAMQKQINALQKQIDTLTKKDQEFAKKDQELEARDNQLEAKIDENSILELDIEGTDQYALMDKPLFGLMTRPGFALSVLKEKNNLDAPIVLGGAFEADLQIWGGDQIPTMVPNRTYKDGTGISFTSANLFAAANVNYFTTVLLSLQVQQPVTTVNMDRGILILGNLDKSPFYFTIGRNFLPLGVFAGNAFLNNPISTNSMRPTPINQAIMSYYSEKTGIQADVGIYQNNVLQQSIKNYLLNLKYTGNIGQMKYAIGAGFINEIRGTGSDVGFMYNNNLFTGPRNGEINANINLNYKDWAMIGEYITSTRSATFTDPTTGQSSNTGILSTWILGGIYKPLIWNRWTYFQVNYSQTEGMQNVATGLLGDIIVGPRTNNIGFKRQVSAEATMEVVKNVYFGPEAQYIWLYDNKKTWVATLDLFVVF